MMIGFSRWARAHNPPWAPCADELSLNFAVGLGSTAIIFYGVQLRGEFVYFWLNCMTTLSNGVREYCTAVSTAAVHG